MMDVVEISVEPEANGSWLVTVKVGGEVKGTHRLDASHTKAMVERYCYSLYNVLKKKWEKQPGVSVGVPTGSWTDTKEPS